MIKFLINGQTLTTELPKTVEKTINYISCSFSFKGNDWDGLTKYLHLVQDDKVYSVLIEDDKIDESVGLNLGAGRWDAFVHADRYDGEDIVKRVTTNVVTFLVSKTGDLDGGVFPKDDPSLADQYLAKINLAKTQAEAAKGAADDAKIAAVNAQAAAEAAKNVAQSSKAAAITSEHNAAAAATRAINAANTATSAVSGIDASVRKAEEAALRSESAKNTAISSETEAKTAATYASRYSVTAGNKANEAIVAASAANTSAANAAQSVSIVEKDATDAKNAAASSSTSASNAKTSENAAKTSERVAAQALSDLLRMLGKDIATLVDGKIPASQIPSIATTEIYTVTTDAERDALSVENGDICIVTYGDATLSKSFIYSNGGWVYLTSPTDYASRAGHAETATAADNAAKINGHRLVEMSAEQFRTAVKDEQTYYLVWG